MNTEMNMRIDYVLIGRGSPSLPTLNMVILYVDNYGEAEARAKELVKAIAVGGKYHSFSLYNTMDAENHKFCREFTAEVSVEVN